MTLVGTATAVTIWLVVGLLAYTALSYAVLFYLPPADRLESGLAVDVAFAATLPFVIAVTWLATIRPRR